MPNELILIILGCLVCGVFMMIGDWRTKRREERQARLNSIKFKNSQSYLSERRDVARFISPRFFYACELWAHPPYKKPFFFFIFF